MRPKDGNSYLGMVVRDNNTWEAVGQGLTAPLEVGQAYQFTVYLARSPKYVSQSRATFKEANYNQPIVLQVWGGNTFCGREALLAASPPIVSDAWTQFSFQFTPRLLIHTLFWKPTSGRATGASTDMSWSIKLY